MTRCGVVLESFTELIKQLLPIRYSIIFKNHSPVVKISIHLSPDDKLKATMNISNIKVYVAGFCKKIVIKVERVNIDNLNSTIVCSE
jgi:hypothetical protein